MRLTQYINESRSKSIKESYAIDSIKKNCKQAIKAFKNDRGIYRGIRLQKDFLEVDPSKGSPRKSANTYNYYTLILDNDARWKSYPKRSRSIICSTDPAKAGRYGFTYVVFPYDGAKIGVAPERDIWDSFRDTTGYFSMGTWNMDLNDMLWSLNSWYPEEMKSIRQIETWKDFKSTFKFIHNFIKNSEDKDEIIYKLNDMSELFGGWDDKSDMFKYIINMFDPKKNGFELSPINKIPKEGSSREVWTDAKSIMISKEWMLMNGHLIYGGTPSKKIDVTGFRV